MPPTPDQSAFLSPLEAPVPPPPEQCEHPLGCLAVVTLYNGAATTEQYRNEAQRGNTEPLTAGELHIQAIEAEKRLNAKVRQRCIRCPLRRTTIYFYSENGGDGKE